MVEKERIFLMSEKEVRRLPVIARVMVKEFTQIRGAELLGLSERQVGRLVVRMREEGESGVVHRLRGRASNRKTSEPVKAMIVELYRQKYRGFGPTFASEKLEEVDGIEVSHETLRKWLIEDELWIPQRKVCQHREYRERRACRGELVQMDGSHHAWLEGRGPKLVLMGYIDDATGEGLGGFYEYEGTVPALDSFYHYVKQNGLPQSVYVDRHQTYQSNARPSVEEELQGRDPQSYFEGVLESLGVEVIHAHSPQAKGRVERFFGTLQDRLVKELRLAGVNTMEEANQFLVSYWPKFNRQFRREARSAVDLHRSVPKGMDLKRVFSLRHERVLCQDNTIQFQGKRYQIQQRWNGSRPKKICVEERRDGKRYLMHGDHSLRYVEIEETPPPVKPKPKKPRRPVAVIPAANHPWRRYPIRPAHTSLTFREEGSRK
jgi:hypothetical protein